jgi:hypothetical protein
MQIHNLFALVFFIRACSGERVEPPPLAPVDWRSLSDRPVFARVDAEKPKVSVSPEGYAAALASPGFEELAPLLDQEAHFAAPGAMDARGRGEVVDAHERLLGAFDNRHVTLNRVWRTPNEQTIEWTMTATQTKDWRGVSATQKNVAFMGLTLLWTKDHATIVDLHVYFDIAVIEAQLGAGPKELRALPPAAQPAGSASVFEQTRAHSYEEKTNVDVVKSSLDALDADRELAYLSSMSDDIEIHTLERAQPLRGKAGARAYYASIHKAIAQLDTTIDNAWGIANFAIVEYSISGEQLGPIGWIRARPDEVVRLELVDICEIRNDRIARIWRYDNPAQIAGEMF